MYYLAITISCLTLICVLLFLRQRYLESLINNHADAIEALERVVRLQTARVNTVTDMLNSIAGRLKVLEHNSKLSDSEKQIADENLDKVDALTRMKSAFLMAGDLKK